MFHEYGHIVDLGHYLQLPDMKNQRPGKKVSFKILNGCGKILFSSLYMFFYQGFKSYKAGLSFHMKQI